MNAERLLLDGVSLNYGGVAALQDVGFEVAPASVVGLIGPNGAGKTSLINAISGIVRPSAGRIVLGEERLDGLAQHRVARAGIARTYQNIRLFGALSVRDNVRAGALRIGAALDDDAVRAVLARTALDDVALERRASTLPYGEQRRLEIARALAGNPAVLLLDEPAAGMNERETASLAATIAAVVATGSSVLLVEHDMTLVNAVSHRVVVLDFGRVIASGTPADVARDPAVVEAYLGTGAT